MLPLVDPLSRLLANTCAGKQVASIFLNTCPSLKADAVVSRLPAYFRLEEGGIDLVVDLGVLCRFHS